MQRLIEFIFVDLFYYLGLIRSPRQPRLCIVKRIIKVLLRNLSLKIFPLLPPVSGNIFDIGGAEGVQAVPEGMRMGTSAVYLSEFREAICSQKT